MKNWDSRPWYAVYVCPAASQLCNALCEERQGSCMWGMPVVVELGGAEVEATLPSASKADIATIASSTS